MHHSPAVTHGSAPAAACRQIQATYIKRYAAYSQRDASGYLALYTPDSVYTDETVKRETFATLRKNVTLEFAHPIAFSRSPYHVEYQITHCVVSGVLATVSSQIIHECAIYHPHTTQVDHYYYAVFRENDVWRRGADGWAIQRYKILSMQHGWPKHKFSL